jgi:hypothetical protein
MPMQWWVGNQEDSLRSLMGVRVKLVFPPPHAPPFFVGDKANETLESLTIFKGT